MGQRVGLVRVAAELCDQHVGPPPPHERRHDLPERLQPGLIPGSGRKGHVHLGPLGLTRTALRDEARSGEQVLPRFMDRHGEDPRVGVEHRLGPVAVVDVDVDVGDPLRTAPQEPGDGHGRVVVDAEPGGPRWHGVMEPSGGVEGVIQPALHHLLRGHQRRPDDQGARLVHPGEDGVVARPVPEARPVAGLALAGSLGGIDELGRVDQADLLVGGDPAREGLHRRPVEQAEVADEVPGEQDALRAERMARPVVVDPGLRAEHQAGPATHVTEGTPRRQRRPRLRSAPRRGRTRRR